MLTGWYSLFGYVAGSEGSWDVNMTRSVATFDSVVRAKEITDVKSRVFDGHWQLIRHWLLHRLAPLATCICG